MRTQPGLIGRFALYALFGSSIAFSACGDDGGDDPSPTGGVGGKATGGTAGIKATGGITNTGGVTNTGGKGTGGTPEGGAPSTGGKGSDAGAGGTSGGAPGEAGETGSGGVPPGGAGGETQGGEGGVAGGAGGAAGGEDAGGSGGEGGALVLGDVYHVYVGCGDSKGNVDLFYVERVTGVITPGNSYRAGSPVIAGTIGPDQDRFYVAHEGTGLITTFARDLDTGALAERDTATVPYELSDGGEGGGGPGPNPGTQALAVHPDGDYLFAANYSSSNVYTFELQADGDVGDLLDGASDGTNAHDAVVSPSGQHLLVPYHGSDEIAVYEILDNGDLLLEDTPLALAADANPRHLAVHSNGDWVYTVNQQSGSVGFLTFDDLTGDISFSETTSVTLPGGYSGDPKSVALAIGENGQYLYVANRLDGTVDGSINIFSIAQSGGAAGELTLLATGGTVSSEGEELSDIALSDDGKVLVAVNEGADNMTVFSVGANGQLFTPRTWPTCGAPRFVRVVAP